MADMYDPLGVGARQRAADYHRQWEEDQREQARQQGQYVSFGQLGPLRDPSWDAYFQVLQEKGVDRLAGGSLPQWQPPPSLSGTVWGSTRTQASPSTDAGDGSTRIIMPAQPRSWQYGDSPAPRNWREAADVLKRLPRPNKTSSVTARLDTIERLFQEKK